MYYLNLVIILMMRYFSFKYLEYSHCTGFWSSIKLNVQGIRAYQKQCFQVTEAILILDYWVILPVCHNSIILHKVPSAKRYSQQLMHSQAFLLNTHKHTYPICIPLLIEMTCTVGAMNQNWPSVEHGKWTPRKQTAVIYQI